MDYSTQGKASDITQKLLACLGEGPMTRQELAAVMGVSRTTLGRALASLRQRGAVELRLSPTPTQRPGRPVELVCLASKKGHSVGIDISRGGARGIITGHNGDVLTSANLQCVDYQSWEEPLSQICAALWEAGKEAGVAPESVAQVGVGVPGVTFSALNQKLSEEIADLEDLVRSFWDAPVLVDNVTRLDALSESRFGAGRDASSLLYVRLSTGVGGCVTVASTITAGATGSAGEMGHITVAGASGKCSCGKRGCLETVASLPAICRRAGVKNGEELQRDYDAGEPAAVAAIAEAAAAVGEVCASAALLVNPEKIILGGHLIASIPSFPDLVQREVDSRLLPNTSWRVPVTTATLDIWGCARGAVTAAEDWNQNPRDNSLPPTEGTSHHECL